MFPDLSNYLGAFSVFITERTDGQIDQNKIQAETNHSYSFKCMYLREKTEFISSAALYFLTGLVSTLRVSVVGGLCDVSLCGSVLCCPTVDYTLVWV